MIWCDWLSASKGEAWGYGDLEAVCGEFGLNYGTAIAAKSVALEYEFMRRRMNLTFAHHREVQGRDDADELLDWCAETVRRASLLALAVPPMLVSSQSLTVSQWSRGCCGR